MTGNERNKREWIKRIREWKQREEKIERERREGGDGWWKR